MSGLLPETFPHEKWVLAVQRSFLTQEAAVCTSRSQWEEVRQILELVQTATVTVESAGGTTLWTKNRSVFRHHRIMSSHCVYWSTYQREISHTCLMWCMWKPLVLEVGISVGISVIRRSGIYLSEVTPKDIYGPSLATVENTVVEPNGTGGTVTKQVFLSESCMAQRFVVRAVALLSAKPSEKAESSEMIVLLFQQALHVRNKANT